MELDDRLEVVFFIYNKKAYFHDLLNTPAGRFVVGPLKVLEPLNAAPLIKELSKRIKAGNKVGPVPAPNAFAKELERCGLPNGKVLWKKSSNWYFIRNINGISIGRYPSNRREAGQYKLLPPQTHDSVGIKTLVEMVLEYEVEQ